MSDSVYIYYHNTLNDKIGMIWGFIANVVYLSTLPELVACKSDCQASSIVFNYLNTKNR